MCVALNIIMTRQESTMRLNVSKLKQAFNLAQRVLPHVKDAVVVATVLNNQSKYKHKGKVNQALVGASAVVTGVSTVVDVVDVVSVLKSK